MTAHPFDDLSNRSFLSDLLARVLEHGATMPIAEVRRLRCARAQPIDAAEHGDDWAESAIDLLERMGVAQLERDGDGQVVVRFTEPLPDAEELEAAWHRAYMENAARRAGARSTG
ncbi:MAG: hypothetical protein JO168_02340 [Solirubrobacterales bacterium]|nr:hypothetical protein [Solirubrobacterales bacterium]MBV9717529.1 hypothetical protein [Solirubrobacterales bacterium]